MSLSFFFCQKQPGRLYYIFGTYFVPFQVGRVFFCGDANRFPIDDQLAFFHAVFNGSFEATVHGIVLEHISHVIYRTEVVNSNDFNVISCLGGTEHKTSDTAKSVNTYFCHCCIVFKKV